MASALKVLGQVAPAANTLTPLYTCAALNGASVSTLTVANRSSSVGATFRISIAVAGAADDVKQYLYYDIQIGPNDTFSATMGVALSDTDVIRVHSSTANLSFSAFGMELS
jgi:hypothetical protein